MRRKIIPVFLVLVALLILALAVRSALSAKKSGVFDDAGQLQPESIASEESTPGEDNSSDMMQEPQDETSLFNENGEDTDDFDVFEEDIFEIGETQAVGGM